MNTKRILAIALALLLTLPAFALADGGSFTLKLSDPVLTISQGGQTTTQDLTGVALQLGGVSDLASANPQALLSLVLLAKDDPAASAMVGMKDNQLYALASGISHVIALPLDKIEEALAQQGAALGLGDQAAALADVGAMLEKFEFTEGPAEDVQFYTTTGNCPRHSAHLTAADLKDLIKDASVNLPEDASLDISYFEDGQGNLRVEGSANNVIESENEAERSLGYVFVIETQDELNYQGGAWIGNDQSELNANFEGSASGDYPDKSQFDLVANLSDVNATDDAVIQMQVSSAPYADDDGDVVDGLSGAVFNGDQLLFQLTGTVFTGEESEYYALSMDDLTTNSSVGVEYTGAIAGSGAEAERAGQLTLGMIDGGAMYQVTLNIALNTSASTDGKFPDISAMPVLNLEDMTQEQQEQLQTEGTQLALTTMGKLMAVPAVATLLASGMQSATGY